MSGHVAPLRLYVAVFLALLGLTAATVAVAFVDLGALNALVALAIAVLKGTVVVLYFMHVRWASKLTRLYVFAAAFFLLVLLVLTMGDYGTRAWIAN